VQSLICLGWVQNTGDEPITNILITVYLLTPQGQPITIAETTSPLAFLSHGKGSPYRVVFQQVPAQGWAVYAELRAVETIPMNAPPAVVDLPVNALETTWNGTEYQIKGNVVNSLEYPIYTLRVVVSFRDQQGRVTGFRVQDLLPNTDSMKGTSFTLHGAPLTGQPNFVSISAQGYLVH
jgi:hypothetical protein